MKTFNKEITIQIVLFEESSNLVLQCLDNLRDFKVIIVDNKGDKKLKVILEEKFQIFKYILNDKNLGYSKGHNQAYQYCQTEFLLIMNADCFIKKEGILNLLDTLKKNKECMIVAPTTFNKHKNLTYNGGVLPENRNKLKVLNLEGDVCVESVLGSAMLIKKSDFKDLALFDEIFFLFFSDDDLCRKVKNKKKSIIQSIHVKAIHEHGESKVKNKLKKVFLRNYHYTSDELYYYYKLNRNTLNFEKLKKKIFNYKIKMILNLITLRLEKSVFYLSKILAFNKFSKFIKNK
jgi:GT2 family glycosyltransferase